MSDPNRAAEKAAQRAAKEAAYQSATAGLMFIEWPKIARLNRDICITEKIDGTNAAIGIDYLGVSTGEFHFPIVMIENRVYRVYAQSRNRILTPDNDNFGFARWVYQHAAAFVRHLGPGLHFGEWWGVGIGRVYDLSERRFSLFNVAKWGAGSEGLLAIQALRNEGAAVYTVPVLYEGPWQQGENHIFQPDVVLEALRQNGSVAVPGFMKPEGICVFHKASGNIFKATCEKDEKHKFEG